jgi:hypothetical protein
MDNLIKNLTTSLFFFFLIFFSSISNAAVIKGRVTDAETHKPVVGAAVSIVGTNIVTVSDARGNYIFNNLKPGSYSVMASCMGYKNSKPVNNILTADTNIEIDINLDPSVIQMNEVVVNGTQNKETNASARSDERNFT